MSYYDAVRAWRAGLRSYFFDAVWPVDEPDVIVLEDHLCNHCFRPHRHDDLFFDGDAYCQACLDDYENQSNLKETNA